MEDGVNQDSSQPDVERSRVRVSKMAPLFEAQVAKKISMMFTEQKGQKGVD